MSFFERGEGGPEHGNMDPIGDTPDASKNHEVGGLALLPGPFSRIGEGPDGVVTYHLDGKPDKPFGTREEAQAFADKVSALYRKQPNNYKQDMTEEEKAAALEGLEALYQE